MSHAATEKDKPLGFQALLLLTAAIWGFAFVAQRAGMKHVGPLTFNAVRFALGSLVLVPVLLLRSRRARRESEGSPSPGLRKLLTGSVACGLILFLGASLQQIGMVYTTAGRAGFITGLYVIIVPGLGLFWRRYPGWKTWLGAGMAISGLYLLSFTGTLSVSRGDLLVLLGAFAWAGHVILIGYLSPRLDNIVLASLQFATCSALSLVSALAAESISYQMLIAALIPILYAGLLSTGVAYTLQVVAQRKVPAATAAIIMSMEAVFAVLGGALLLNESLPWRGLTGCGLMLAGMLASQLDPKALHPKGLGSPGRPSRPSGWGEEA